MVCTRSSSSSEESFSMEDAETVISKTITSDAGKAIKVVISPKASISLPIVSIPNPKSGMLSLYVIGSNYCLELIQSNDLYRSWFYGEDIIEDGSFRLYSPINPLFLALPYFIQAKDKFMELDDILCDSNLTALKSNNQLLKNLSRIADKVCDTCVYRYNEGKTLEWIKTRLEKVKMTLLSEEGIHKCILEDEEVLNRYCFEILSDYLSSGMVGLAKEYLQIKDAIVEERVDMTYKRKVETETSGGKVEVKKFKESVVKKQLVQASKGTKSISSFFSKK